MALLISIVHSLITWLNSALPFSKQEQVYLELHRDMWTGKRKPNLEKTVRHYSF